jgi:hypothetical protein
MLGIFIFVNKIDLLKPNLNTETVASFKKWLVCDVSIVWFLKSHNNLYVYNLKRFWTFLF